MCMSVYVHVSDVLGITKQLISILMWVLGVELGPSARTIRALTD